VEEATTYKRRVNNGCDVSFERESLSQYLPKHNAIETFSGLRSRVEGVLKKRNYNVTHTRKDFKPLETNLDLLTEEDLGNLENRDDQIAVMGLVCDHPDGFIVKAPTGWGKSYLICQVAQVLPTARIAIVAPGQEIVKTLYKRLKRRIRDVGIVGGGENHITRITVSTMESIHKLDTYEWDLLLFDEVHKAAAPATSNNVASIFNRTKCVGLSASPDGRSDGADLVTEALFGPIIYEVDYNEGVERGAVVPIKVKMYKVDVGPSRKFNSVAATNRNGLWRNEARNKLIAKLAKQIPEDEQVLITVGTVEHALFLREHLPDFEVVFSHMTNKTMLKWYHEERFQKIKGFYKGELMKGRREALRVAFEKGELKRAIATSLWNTGVDFQQLKYLIRADGMASDILSTQTPGRLSRTNDGKKDCGYLIDFIDAFHPSLDRRSQQRRRHYLKHNWELEVVSDPDVTQESFSKLRKNKNG